MDSVLIISEQPEQYSHFLERLGYNTLCENSQEKSSTLIALFNNRVIDLVLLDGTTVTDHAEIVTFLRGQELTKLLPIIVVANTVENGVTDSNADGRLEVVEPNTSKGIIASRAAMLLRLRKVDGKNPNAHIADLNAALRDFSEKLTKDLEEAQEIQLATLPKSIPYGETFDIAYSYEPLEELGGDWFFIQEESDSSISFLVADVTGHGLAAAFIGAWIKLALWAVSNPAPEIRLAEMNRHITPQMPDGRFITMTCLNYSPSTGVLRQARAGHPPTFLLRANSHEVIQLLGDGFALGFFDEGSYEALQETLAIGDVVVLCTDGIVEAANMNSKLYGPEGVVLALQQIKPEDSAQSIMETVIKDLTKFTDGRIIKDDVTLIVLKRTA
jgi:phosphoserine phosphatase RsbU/P